MERLQLGCRVDNLPDEMKSVIFSLLVRGPAVVKGERGAELSRWQKIADGLSGREHVLHSHMVRAREVREIAEARPRPGDAQCHVVHLRCREVPP